MDFAKDWGWKDSALLGGALASVYQDTQSTKDTIRRGGIETNPLIGRNPSDTDLDRAGLLAGALGTGAVTLLPESWRKPVLGGWMGTELGLANYNRGLGGKGKNEGMGRALTAALPSALLGTGLGYLLDKYGAQPSVDVNTVKTPDGRSIPEYRIGFTKNFAKGGLLPPPVGFARASSIDKRNLTYRSPKGFARLKRGV